MTDISVVMPAYNEAEFLATSVKSVVEGLRQLGGTFELIDPAVLAQAAAPPEERATASGEGIIGWRLVARKL